MSKDTYKSFADLKAHEREGTDFRIRVAKRRSPVAVIAPHGGKIEARTSAITMAIADDLFSSYCFEGLKKKHNETLHITSHRFDEPRCLALIAKCDRVVGVHGLSGIRKMVIVGGRDRALRNRICAGLTAARFNAVVGAGGRYSANDPRNICNRGKKKKGVQLEITRALRSSLKGNRLARFADSIREVLTSAL